MVNDSLIERIERIEKWIDFWETIETGWSPCQHTAAPNVRPIFGEGSPHDIGEHLEKVCASEISVVERVARIEKWIDFWETIETGWNAGRTTEPEEGGIDKELFTVVCAERDELFRKLHAAPKPVSVSLKKAAEAIDDVMAHAVVEPRKNRMLRAAKACAEIWGLSYGN